MAGPVADANEKPMSGPIHMDAGRPGQPRWLTCAVLAAAIAAPGLVLAQKEIPVSGSLAVEKPVKDREVAFLAGGCFWGMQDILRKIPGVLETQAGYTGGWLANPRYEDTHDSKSGHAEAVRVVFDPRMLSYADLLEKWFFRMHDPTTLNRQGNDVGTQYRSAIFYEDEAQHATALAVIARVQASGHWKGKIVTEVARASTWYPAEGYHQDYLQRNPGGYTCHYLRSW